MQEKLVEKSYMSGRLYYDLKQYRAATVSLSNSLKEYPDTKYREELMFLKLDALYMYAQKSIPDKTGGDGIRQRWTIIIHSLKSFRRANTQKMWRRSSRQQQSF